ncbi:MAG: hypothetical protein HQK51_07940 [Oligoflexia bacterium]|nr:hypothetical protein [Oligoflexia bacterium]
MKKNDDSKTCVAESNEQLIASGDYNRISPTAKLIAYTRQFSDIPFAKEIANITNSQEVLQKLITGSDQKSITEQLHFFSIFAESRYKSTMSTIKRFNIKQVLEFASGLSFRGPIMSDDIDSYVETDLPGIMDIKFDIISKIPEIKKQLEKGNVFFHTANALVYEEIEKTLIHFNPNMHIGIVHEGLLMYLTMKEKEIMAQNCRKLLDKFGGVWITPDLRTKVEMEKLNKYPSGIENIKVLTGRDFNKNCFESDEEIVEFYYNLGFDAKYVPQVDGSYEITCSKNLNIPTEFLNELLPKFRIWTLLLR